MQMVYAPRLTVAVLTPFEIYSNKLVFIRAVGGRGVLCLSVILLRTHGWLGNL